MVTSMSLLFLAVGFDPENLVENSIFNQEIGSSSVFRTFK